MTALALTPSVPTTVLGGVAAFSHVTESLLETGATPVLAYLNFPTSSQGNHGTPAPLPQDSSGPARDIENAIPRAVARLHQTCQHVFGNVDCLNFVFEDDAVGQAKRCVLTITRPNGETRTFASPQSHVRKYDAKASVCTLAIQNGAIEFIMSGEDGLAASSSGPSVEASEPPLEMDESVKTIEQCCLETTGGKVVPYWLTINEPKFGRTMGCALRIRLGPRCSRVYSVNPTYSSPAEARKACAETALAEGVIDFVKTWTPKDTPIEVAEQDLSASIALQEFFESLPQPFPESSEGRTATEINGPAWLNTTIQSARGGKIVPKFIWTVNPAVGLHGCLLRLERPGEVKSYLVDARFSKRMEAKAAVCLLAMSEGVGDYIRAIGKAVEDRLSPSARKHVHEVLLPTLQAEYRKVRGPGMQPTFEYDADMDACGATMILELAQNPSPQQMQKYTVPAEYRNRVDARLAVVLHAVEQGAIEFLRFQGKPPPPGYVPYFAHQDHQFLNRKRKTWDSGDGSYGGGGPNSYGGQTYPNGGSWQSKKPRTAGGFQQQGGFAQSMYANQGNGQAQSQYGSGKGFQNGNRPGWNGQKRFPPKKHYATGPGQYGGATGHPAPSFEPEPRSVGGYPRQQQQWSQSSSQPPIVGGVSPHLQQPVNGTSYAFPSNGPMSGTNQSSQAAFLGTGPQGSHITVATQYQAQGVPTYRPPLAPFAAPSVPSAPGVTYPPYLSTQTRAPLTGAQVPSQYPSQYSYGTGPPYASPHPGQGQAAGFLTTPAVASQPQPAGFYTASGVASTSTLRHTSHSSPAPPNPPFIPVLPQSLPVVSHSPAPPIVGTPGYLSYQSPLGNQHKRVPQPPQASPPPQPPQPPQPPTVPPPPPPNSIPPPPPPSTSAPPLPPQVSAMSMPERKTAAGKVAQTHVASKGGKVAIQAIAKTNVTALYDYCNTKKLQTPQWCHEIIKDDKGNGEAKHKVWVVIGKTKFELPVQFSSLSQGQDKVAKKVLDQLSKAAKS